MPQVVGREVQLHSLGRQCALGYRHDAGVVDQDVERTVPVVDERRDRVGLSELQGSHTDGIVARRVRPWKLNSHRPGL